MSQGCMFGNGTESTAGEPEAPKVRKHKKHDYHTTLKACGSVQTSLEVSRDDLITLEQLRPKKRSDCGPAREALGVTGCPWVRCKYNLLVNVHDGLDVEEDIVELERDLEDPTKPLERKWTCALDFVEQAHGIETELVPDIASDADWLEEIPLTPVRELVSDETVGEALGLSGEWVRQTVKGALTKIRPDMAKHEGRVLK